MNLKRLAVVLLACAALLPTSQAQSQPAKLGAVIMHGKGGSPASLVSQVAEALEAKGFAVANLEMPWSGNRTYDVDTSQADKQVETAIADLKAKGAAKVFVMGHSQGGVFALHYATGHPVDGVVAMAPGGSVDSQSFYQQVGASLSRAKQLVAEGRGAEKQRLDDYEGSRGSFTVVAPPAAYVTWFDPDGAMSMTRTLREFPASVPVLWVSPTGDYPGLRRSASQSYAQLPKNPLNRFVEPNTGHKGAPRAAIPAILEWTAQVAAGR